jgi:multiple sugar transport system ATP-binding protein
VYFGSHRLLVDGGLVDERPAVHDYLGKRIVLGIRPEDMEDAAYAVPAPSERRLPVVCGLREALGSEVLVHFPVGSGASEAVETGDEWVEPLGEEGVTFVARVNPRTRAREGEPIELTADTSRLHFFDLETGAAIGRSASREAVHT